MLRNFKNPIRRGAEGGVGWVGRTSIGCLGCVLVLAAAVGSGGVMAEGDAPPDAPAPRLERYAFEQPHMGTVFRIVLYAADRDVANRAAEAGFARVAELNARLSDYDAGSEVRRLCAAAVGEPVPVSDDLWRVLRAAEAAWRESDGAFDVTLGALSRLWRRARSLKELPKPEDIAENLDNLGFQNIKFSEESRAVRLLRSGLRIDLGGIAKGYALDEVLVVLRRDFGIARALVDGGGDVAVGDPPPGRDGWRVEVRGNGGMVVELANGAVATSGDLYQFVEIGGKRWSHLIDPRTGWALADSAAATVVVAGGMEADALASALCVLSDREGRALAERREGVEARVSRLGPDGDEVWWGTGRFAGEEP